MSNQMIGIAGVFALTLFLLLLRHCLLLLGRPNRSRHVNPTAPRGNLELHAGRSRMIPGSHGHKRRTRFNERQTH
jgi:hypothetical protein